MNVIRTVIATFLTVILVTGAAMAVEEPPFTTLVEDGNFEIRDYPALLVAEVTVSGAQKEAANKGFRLLADYIFGNNTSRQDIAMTAPVAQQKESEKIAMTAPVSQIEEADSWIVRFTMPGQYTLETLPTPNDPAVRIKRLPPTRFAVLRFSGRANEKSVAEKSAELTRIAATRGLRATGPITLAQYNPPWIPGFMRRNEVQLPIAR